MDVDVLQAIARALGGHPGVVAAYLFGSTARAEDGPGSDVDVAVLDRPDRAVPSWRRIARYTDAIRAELPGRRIDVVLLSDVPVRMADRILREGIVLLDADPVARYDFEESTLVRYLDDLPMQQAWERDFDEAMRGPGT